MRNTEIKMLLIEDEQGDHRIVQHAIAQSAMNSKMTRARTLNEGITRLASETFDVVLSDLSLPDACGLEGVKKIRKLNATVPIVILTTLDDPKLEAEALDAGAQDYLPKHFTLHGVLDRTIQHAIQRQENTTKVLKLMQQLQIGERKLRRQKTLLKKKNRDLEQLYQTAQRFVDNVSHEFRTPLTVIKHYV